MKRAMIWLSLLVFLISCAPPTPATEQPAFVETTPQNIQNLDPVEKAVTQRLSDNLGLTKTDIIVASNQEVEFGNACMDIAFPGVMCAQVVTPGRVIVLEAGGIEYEYHTSIEGDLIQPANIVLIWTREGGIVGFCDQLIVFLSGEVYGSNCRAQPREMESNFANLFSASERKQFKAWFSKFGEINLDVSDPTGVSDRMENTLLFYGSGSGKPSKADEQALFDWANELFQKLYS